MTYENGGVLRDEGVEGGLGQVVDGARLFRPGRFGRFRFGRRWARVLQEGHETVLVVLAGVLVLLLAPCDDFVTTF